MSACGLVFGPSNSAGALPTGQVLPIDPAAVEPRLFRSVLFFPEDSKASLAGGAGMEAYLGRSEGRFIQSIKGCLPSASFTATAIRNKPMKLEELVAML